MTIKDLYAMCENLGSSTYFEIRKTDPYRGPGELLADGRYIELHPKWYEMPVKGFNVQDYGYNCIVYV